LVIVKKGSTQTLESRKKMSKANRGKVPWNKGTKGKMPPPWNKGKTGSYSHSLATRRKMSKSRKKITHEGLFKKGNVPWDKGTRGIMKPNKGSFKKGHAPWYGGKKKVQLRLLETKLARLRSKK